MSTKTVRETYWRWRCQLIYGSALAHCRYSTDTSKCQCSKEEVPTGAGDGSWGGERWRTAVGVLIRPNVNEVSQRRLLELPITTRVRDCVGSLQMEH